MQAVSRWGRHSVFALCAFLAVPAVAQQTVERGISKEKTRVSQAAKAQDQVDAVHDETRQRIEEYKAVEKQIEGLKAYLEQLDLQIADQADELGGLKDSIAEVTVIERQITPLMLRMIDALEQFVQLDVPFLLEERQARVARLKALMGSADVTVAEKFRSVMNAFETEIEYGNTIEAFRGPLKDGSGEREVDFLRVGRLAMFYQSLDGTQRGRWNGESGSWESLPGEYAGQIQQGIRIARSQVAPDLIRLPLLTAEASR